MNFAEANRRYFDAISDSYDSKPWFATVNNQVTEALRGDLSWVGIPFAHDANAPSQVRLLDYACGTGLMTRVFGPYVTQTMGLDISPNMVSTYNKRAQSAGLSPETVHAVCGNLFDKSDPHPTAFSGPEWQGFDLATVGFGFHHFEDVVHSARQLKERLRPGGVLVINDFLEGGDWLADEEGKLIEGSRGNHAVHRHDHGDHSHGHGHGHGHKDDHHQDTHHHGHEHHGHTHHHHGHGHQSESNEEAKLSLDDTTPEFKKKMTASIVVPHFTLDGVKEFFMQAGFVDVDVITMKEKSYMEFGGKKLWRTILFARGRRPMVEEENDGLRSEL